MRKRQERKLWPDLILRRWRQTGNYPFTYYREYSFCCVFAVCFYRLVMTNSLDCLFNYCFVSVFVFLLSVAGRQTVLVHHQTGIAVITVTALGYQALHLAAAKVPSPVSDSTSKICLKVFFTSSK